MLETNEARLVSLGDRPEDVLEIIAGEDPRDFTWFSPGKFHQVFKEAAA